MLRKQKLIIAKTAVVMGTIPLLIWAHASGPDVGKSGVPGESTCAEAGCHVGTALNGGGGSVKVAFPAGLSYTPGVRQHLVVTISDPAQKKWGFQMTARQSANTKTMAGAFSSTDRNTAVICGATPTDPAEVFLDFGQSQNCAASKPFAYVEHTEAGSSRLQAGSQTYEFDWTPPATAVGNINLYVAGNAANGTGDQSGDHIYTASYTLTPGAASPTPAIDSNGVQNGASFQPGIVPNAWITIKGSNLSSVRDTWDKAIVDGKLPTSLDGVSVTIAGKPAYIYFVSPEQINAIAPDVGSGTMSVTVTNGNVTSAALTATANPLSPAFFLWPSNQAVATHTDGTFAVKNGTFSGVATVPAKPGEFVVVWGTGFGPTSPAAPLGTQTPAGQIYSTSNAVSATVNGAPAAVYLNVASLAPGFAGLYQVAIQVPANAPDGDLPLVASVGGVQSPTGVTIAVQH